MVGNRESVVNLVLYNFDVTDFATYLYVFPTHFLDLTPQRTEETNAAIEKSY